MFGFGKRKKAFSGKSRNEQMLETMKSAVEKQIKEAPFEPFIATGQDVADLVLDSVEEEGAHALDTALCVVGALAGHAAALYGAEVHGSMAEGEVMPEDYERHNGADGRVYFSGALIDEALIGGSNGFWKLVTAKVKSLSGDDLPGLAAISDHADATMGGPEFGMPRMPGGTVCLERPDVLAHHLWAEFLPILAARRDETAGFTLSLGFAAQEIIEEARGTISATDCARILMECAVPVARMDVSAAEGLANAA